MTTGVQELHMVGGKTIRYELSFEERIAEALGEVPEEPALTDVIAFGAACYKALSLNKEIDDDIRGLALNALGHALNDASQRKVGMNFF